jgi:hypothetical protein
MATDSVRRFLVTGPDDNLARFHLAVAFTLNGLERREQTVIYTCFAEHADLALRAAEQTDVTVQELEIHGTTNEELYPVRHLGSHGLKWIRPSLRAAKKPRIRRKDLEAL